MSIRKICRLGLAVVPGLLVAWGIAQAEEPQNILDEMNDELVAMGAEVRISKVEYVTTGENFQSGRTILVSDRGDKQFDEDFVPGDPRRGFRTDITWVIDAVDSATFTVVTPANQRAAIRRAMGTWDSVSCSDIPLTDLGDVGDVGALQFLFGFGGSFAGLIGFPAPADVIHAGFLPGSFFDLLVPGGGGFIIGLTVTFTWDFPLVVDPLANADIDGNGKTDVAFRETYYNNAFPWGIDTNFPIDIESIVLHETGHGLSQAHFGDVFVDAGAETLHFAPRAVMNAAYSGVQQELTGTDDGGHCSNWANWPEN